MSDTVALRRTFRESVRRITVAWLVALGASVVGCASRHAVSCYPSSFTDLQGLSVDSGPDDVSCVLSSSSGLREPDQELYVSRSEVGPPFAVLTAWTSENDSSGCDAPLDERLAGMITRICNEFVRQHTSCVHTGHDGVWYLVQVPGGAGSAVTKSPKQGTRADAVIDLFKALRAYVASEVPARPAAMQTLYREAYAAQAVLGLSDEAHSEQ